MKLYHFDPISREYTHATFPIKNPKSENEYLAQAYSTADPIPDITNNQVIVRSSDDASWLIKDDYRGIVWETDTKQERVHSKTGPLPIGLTHIEPQPFDHWQSDRWIKNLVAEAEHNVQQARLAARLTIDAELSKPIEFDGVLFDYDKSAKASILETIEEAQILAMSDSESTGWRLADNTIRETSVSDLKDIVKIGALRRREANDQYTAWTEADMQVPFKIAL